MKTVLAFVLVLATFIVIASTPAQARCIDGAPYYFGRGEAGSVLADVLLLPGSIVIGVAASPTPKPRGELSEPAICMPLNLAAHLVTWRSVEARVAIERGLQ